MWIDKIMPTDSTLQKCRVLLNTELSIGILLILADFSKFDWNKNMDVVATTLDND
ncbi:MAG: hypothetical protein RR954_08235 [Christensenellaceae bacterium]